MKSPTAFGGLSAVISSLIGFVVGLYMPIGMLPEPVRTILNLLPISYAAALMRNLLMHESLLTIASEIATESLKQLNVMYGLDFRVGGVPVTPAVSLLFIAMQCLFFMVLSSVRIQQMRD